MNKECCRSSTLSHIFWLTFMCFLASGCVSSNTESYDYPSPIKTSSGCPSITGAYVIESGKPLEPGSGYLLGSYAAINVLAHNDESAEEKWQKYFEGNPSKYETPIEVQISGDSYSELAISVFSGEEHQLIFNTELSQRAGDFSCRSGYIVLKKNTYDAYDHECCSGRGSNQSALTNAQDGALIARTDSTFTGIVLVVPAHQSSRSWYAIKKKAP